uniref:Polyprenal reductase n=1 Tax=Romanomermis culicivorax TaxID=13658 RepID=A0A915IPP2_ROMCU
WFSHFYIFASIWAFFCWEQLIFYYYFDIKPWPILTFIVDQMAKPGIGKRTGNITNYAHGIPITYYFDYVSCPHFLFEILIYFSLILTSNLRNLQFFGGVFLFVSTNQIAAALITHRWYREKYKKMYPENRKALLPYLF